MPGGYGYSSSSGGTNPGGYQRSFSDGFHEVRLSVGDCLSSLSVASDALDPLVSLDSLLRFTRHVFLVQICIAEA